MSEIRNPYAAPDAVVADVITPQVAGPRPVQVRRACMALWLSFLITLVTTPFSQMNGVEASGMGLAAMWTIIVMVIVVSALFTWWFTAKLSAGRNWMRWLLNILLGFSLLGLVALLVGYRMVLESAVVNPLDVIGSLVQLGLSIYVLVLINSSAAREWFTAMKRSRA